jgi:leucyl/phenylalanyl-tRNA---protein transferase
VLFILDHNIAFPPPHLAEPDGLLAMGGDLSTERLLLAYRNGIFPWYEGEDILWWSPDPRCVLFPEKLKLSKSLRPMLNRNAFRFTVNTAFEKVIHHCKSIPRAGQDGTWITDDMINAYINLHKLGHAHSAEVWEADELVGGLYGIRMGKVFFGESMFSLQSNASRYAFARYVELLKREGVALIDCQVHTPYLESMGAEMISGDRFRDELKRLTD